MKRLFMLQKRMANPFPQQSETGLPRISSKRKTTVIKGDTLHENSIKLDCLPQGYTEVVNPYMTCYEGMNLEGALTTFQTGTYSKTQQIPADAVMVYCVDNKDQIESAIKAWSQESDQYEIHVMTLINRTNLDYEYLSGHPSRLDQIMTDKNGNRLIHSGTVCYMMPNDEWTEYLWEMVEKMLDAANIKVIAFEEPDIWKASGYSECFKREWEKYYGEPWQDQSSSPEAMYKSQQLKVYLINHMMETIITRIKKKSPDTKVYLATHSTPSYNIVGCGSDTSGVLGIASGTNQYMATGLYDGFIGQTWSDTAGALLTQNGNNYQNRYLAAYLGYASYVDSVRDLDLYTLADPVSDGVGSSDDPETVFHSFYFDTIVAQLMQPTINRYEVMPWSDRAFEPVSQDYRAIQLSVIKAQQEVAGKAAVQSAGTPGISYVLSDTLSYPLNSNTTWAPSSNDSFMGLTLPLISDGIPLTITAMENIKSADDLACINVLLLSFDGQKPMSKSVCEAIADWIKQGGICLYIGGHDAYDQMENAWWKAYGTPLQALLNMLNLKTTIKPMQLDADACMDWLGSGKQLALEAMLCSTSYNNFYSCFENSNNAISNLIGHTVGVDEAVGKGHLIAFGLPAALLTHTVGGSEVLRSLTEYACQYTEYEYAPTSFMCSKRGNVVAAYSLGQENVLAGRYINLFDTKLGVHTNYVLKPDTGALLYDITNLDCTNIPKVAFSGGKLSDVKESANETKFHLDSTQFATVATCIIAPKGLYPQNIQATNHIENVEQEALCAWNSSTRALLVRLIGTDGGINVAIKWGKDPVSDYELKASARVRSFAPVVQRDKFDELVSKGMSVITAYTNQWGNSYDKEFIIANTALVNDRRYYCDWGGEVVWRIDLNQYKDAYITMNVMQNYLLEVSADGEQWTEIQNFIKVNGYRVNACSNSATIGIDSKIYAANSETLYVRLSNADPSQGWGGAVTKYQIFYYSK